MRVTSVELNFHPKPQHGKFKCWAKVVFEDVLLVTGIRLFENKQGDSVERYIRFPDRQISLHSTGGEYVSVAIVNTNNEELRKHITEAVFTEYDKHQRNPANWKRREERSERRERM